MDMTVLMALSSIAVEQTKATEKTTSPDNQKQKYLLNIHSDASYLSEAKARSRACGHFFPGMDATRWRTN
jgi:hypothetical protein